MSNQRASGLRNSQPLGNVSFDKHKIRLSVSLYHNGEKIDMTPHILQVKTHMGIGEASGRFTLLLTFKKRWERYVTPMDYVEISFSRFLTDPPTMMRGFVGNIRRTRIMDSSGKLHRAYTINGENFGKIWSNYYIEYLVQEIGQTRTGTDIDPSTDSLMANMLSENYGIMRSIPASGNIQNADLVRGFLDAMLNPYIDVLRSNNPHIPRLNSYINVLSDYAIINGPLIQGINNQTVYDVLNQFGNRPWCEYFIDDYSDGPLLMYRNTPFKDENGFYPISESEPKSEYDMIVDIDDTHIIEEDVGTSDNEVYSYFFTYPTVAMYAQVDPRAMILGDTAFSIEQESDTVAIYNPHVDLNNMSRFGFKPLMIASNSIPFESSGDLSQSSIQLAQNMNIWLVKSLAWSQNMLNGTIKLKGNEHLRIGRYVRQHSTGEEYYIESVDHDISLSQVGSTGNDGSYHFETTIGVTRGRVFTEG